MQYIETLVKLNESDHAYVSSVVESGEFESVSDYFSHLISLHRHDIVDPPEVIEMIRERYEDSLRNPGRRVTKEQLLEEFHERARRKGLLPPKQES